MRISDWSSDVCSSDLELPGEDLRRGEDHGRLLQARGPAFGEGDPGLTPHRPADPPAVREGLQERDAGDLHGAEPRHGESSRHRSEEHKSELQELMRISYAVFCLKKETQDIHI